MTNPADDLLRISMSHGLPRCLHAVAELGIADALGESPRSAEELARDTRTHAGALARTLRVLSAEGIFEARDGAWGHTPASRLLRSDHPQSMRSFVRMIGLSVYWRGFEVLRRCLDYRTVHSRESRPRRLLEVPQRESAGGPSFRRGDDGKSGGTNCRHLDVLRLFRL